MRLSAQNCAFRVDEGTIEEATYSRHGALILLFILFSSTFHNFSGTIFVLCMAPFLKIMDNGKVAFPGLAIAFFAAACFAFIRVLFPSSVDLLTQFQEVARFLGFLVFCIFLRRVRLEDIDWAVNTFVVFCCIVFPFYVLGYGFSIIDSSGERRFSSFLPHANHFAYVLSVFLLYRLYEKMRGNKWGYAKIISMGFAIFALLLTKSSGGLSVLLIGMITLPISVKLSIKYYIIYVLTLCALSFVMISPIGEALLNKLEVVNFERMLQKAQSLNFGDQGSSFAWRLSYWIALIDAQIESGAEYVWLGHGGGSATVGNWVYFFMSRDPHSDFVKVFIEYGLIGFFVIFGSIIVSIYRGRAGLLGTVFIFGPMIAGNSLVSPAVMMVLISFVELMFREKAAPKGGGIK